MKLKLPRWLFILAAVLLAIAGAFAARVAISVGAVIFTAGLWAARLGFDARVVLSGRGVGGVIVSAAERYAYREQYAAEPTRLGLPVLLQPKHRDLLFDIRLCLRCGLSQLG